MNIGLNEFMSAALGEMGHEEVPCLADARPGRDRRPIFPARRWVPDRSRIHGATYYNISTLKQPAVGQKIQRTRDNCFKTHVIVLDDIGTKIDEKKLAGLPAPHYILETSPGNHQWGYCLKPSDPKRAEALIRALAEAGFTDRGATGANRLFRVPGSINYKNGMKFAARIVEWYPSDPRWDVDELAKEFGVTLVDPEPPLPYVSVAALEAHAAANNPLFMHLTKLGLLPVDAERNTSGWYPLKCPRADEHTGGDTSGTYVRFNIDGSTAFKCFHSHGDSFRTPQFLDWVKVQGGPVSSAVFTWDEPDLLLLEPDRGPVPEPPLDTLPREWREWILAASAAAGAPAGFVLLGLFAAAAGACGAGVCVRIGPRWLERLVLWAMMVAAPSSGKSPALEATRHLLAEIDRQHRDQNLRKQTEYAAARAAAALLKHASKRPAGSTPQPGPEPKKPSHLQLIIGNTTIEALAAALEANPRGLLAIHDELSSLLSNLERYSGGTDRPLYIEAWAAARWIINRRHLEKPIEIPRAAVSILGGIQPEKLRGILEGEDDDGLVARFLFVWPDAPRHIPLFERLGGNDAWAAAAMHRIWLVAGSPTTPLTLDLDPHAFNETDRRLVEMARREEGFRAGFVGKGRGTITRLAGILTLLEWATSSDATPPTVVSRTALDGAIKLWEQYFLPHAAAVFRVGGRGRQELRLRKVALYLRNNRLYRFRRETIRVHALGRTLDAPDIDPILRDLEGRGLIRPVPRATSGPGRPPLEWEANPQLFE
jgi:hypothetical protein